MLSLDALLRFMEHTACNPDELVKGLNNYVLDNATYLMSVRSQAQLNQLLAVVGHPQLDPRMRDMILAVGHAHS